MRKSNAFAKYSCEAPKSLQEQLIKSKNNDLFSNSLAHSRETLAIFKNHFHASFSLKGM